MRYFLIDRVTELLPGERARGVKCVTLGDEVLHDHFPDFPILPGALLVEAAAQLAGFLLECTVNRAGEPPLRALMVQIRNAKFHEAAGPGDAIEIAVSIDSRIDTAAEVTADARVGDRRLARAQLTFVMKRIESERLHEQRRTLYRLWTRDLNPKPTIL
jgi:3-hydroxyacyl-[acyl-carrier-protein] dehydratase